MKTLVRILIITDNDAFVKSLKDLIDHPQIDVDSSAKIPQGASYNFYVLDSSDELNKIELINEGSPIYLSDHICDTSVPIRNIIKCNIVGCLDDVDGMSNFVTHVRKFRKQKSKMHEVSTKLDCLKSGDFESLARKMQKTESERFVDYIQNHPLPMVLVNCGGDVLHANVAMEDLIGCKLPGLSASKYWLDTNAFDKTLCELKKEGQLLGREVTLKSIDGESLQMKLYTSIHYDDSDNWINTRCLFVPIPQTE